MSDFVGPVITRECKCCGESKPLHDFKRVARNNYGRGHECRTCDKARSKQWRLDNVEKSREAARRQYHKDPAAAAARQEAWRVANPDRVKAGQRRWREANREAYREYLRAWHEKNPEAQRAYTVAATERRRAEKSAATAYDVPLPEGLHQQLRQIRRRDYIRNWRSANKDRAQLYQSTYRARHLDKCRLKDRKVAAQRREMQWKRIAEINDRARAQRHLRRPQWVRYEDIHQAVEAAAQATGDTGVKHEVDHFYPLVSPFVSGLDVPANRRVVPKSVNRRKSNKIPAEALAEFAEIPPELVFWGSDHA